MNKGSSSTSYCTFRLGGELLGVDVRAVQEVLQCNRFTNVPLASKLVRGLMNLRGQIVTVVDIRQRLGMPPSATPLELNVVLHSPDRSISMLVDAIGDVIDVDQAEFEPPPISLDDESRELILGAYKLKDELLLVLNPEACLKFEAAPAN